MSTRKISNDALCKVLNGCRSELEMEVRNRRWFITSVSMAVNWASETSSGKASSPKDVRNMEIKSQLDHIEALTRQIRDIEHAIAALDSEDTPNAQ